MVTIHELLVLLQDGHTALVSGEYGITVSTKERKVLVAKTEFKILKIHTFCKQLIGKRFFFLTFFFHFISWLKKKLLKANYSAANQRFAYL